MFIDAYEDRYGNLTNISLNINSIEAILGKENSSRSYNYSNQEFYIVKSFSGSYYLIKEEDHEFLKSKSAEILMLKQLRK